MSKEPCKHENLEHFPANDINEGSLPFTICLDCDISPEDLAIILEPDDYVKEVD